MLSEKPWRVEAVLRFCGALVVCWCAGLTVAGLLQMAGVGGFARPDNFGVTLLSTLSLQGMAWALIPIFLRQHRVRWRETFGLRGPRRRRALLLALLVVLVILPVAWLLEQASAAGLTKLGWPVEEQTPVRLLANAKSWWIRVYLGAFAVAIAPVAEEFIFRGVLHPFIKQLGYPCLAWLGVSALFALIHANVATFVPLFVLALALAWLYEKTDNLLAPITAHALFNTANLVVLLVAQNPPFRK
jgi:hypothetical protein